MIRINDKVTRVRRIALAALGSLVLVACGGGDDEGAPTPSNSNSSTGTPVATGATASMTGSSTSKVIDTTQSGAVTVASTTASDGSTHSTITLPADLATTMAIQTGSTLVIPAGQGTRFPLGLVAVIGKTTADPVTGQVTLEATPPTLQDAYSKFSAQGNDIPLSADNFVGAVAPLAISGGNAVPTATQTGLLRQTGEVKVLNGALTLTTSKLTGIQAGLDISKPDLRLGEIALVTEVKLSDLLTESEASKYQPYGKSGEATVSISMKISDLMLTQKAEFEDVLGVPYSLKSLDYKLKGAITGEIKLVGGLTGNLGYYSQAWHETEVEAVKLLGVSGKLLGLDAKDKIGKIPLAGLVFSLPCAKTAACPVLPGTTQTPIRQAATGGVIVWLYFNAKGQITFDGTVGARINAGFELGAQQPEGGELAQTFKFFRKTQDKNLLEVPFVQGELTAQANLGPAVDMDVFLGGVRFLNLALDAGAQANLNVNAEIANVLSDVGQPWQWQGNACMTTSVGAGVVTNLRIGVGGEVKTGWNKVDDKLTGRLTFERQAPTESDRATPGTYYVMGIPVWHTYLGNAMCFPAPTVETSSLSLNGTVYEWVVTGKNLPDDLELSVATSGVCGSNPQLSWRVVDAGSKATFTCLRQSTVSTASGSFSSVRATNLGGNTRWNWQVENLPPEDCTPPQVLQSGVCANPPAITNGACGSSNGVAASSAPTISLCSTGTAGAVTGSGPWSWSCSGSNGGASASCSASKLPAVLNGLCGSANGVAVSSAPNSNLCSSGTIGTVEGNGPWNWSCNGGSGGTNASCSASLAATATIPGSPQNLGASASDGQSSLSWSAPSSNGGSMITSYRVFRGTNSANTLIVTSGGCANLGATLSCTDTGLINGQSYYYIVSAVNDVGQGAPSEPATVTPSVTNSCTETEPNNSSLSANSLPLSVGCTGRLSSASDVDWWKVQADTGQLLTFITHSPPGANFNLEVYGPTSSHSGIRIICNGNQGDGICDGSRTDAGGTEFVSFTTSVAGTFYARIVGVSSAFSGTENYTIQRTD